MVSKCKHHWNAKNFISCFLPRQDNLLRKFSNTQGLWHVTALHSFRVHPTTTTTFLLQTWVSCQGLWFSNVSCKVSNVGQETSKMKCILQILVCLIYFLQWEDDDPGTWYTNNFHQVSAWITFSLVTLHLTLSRQYSLLPVLASEHDVLNFLKCCMFVACLFENTMFPHTPPCVFFWRHSASVFDCRYCVCVWPLYFTFIWTNCASMHYALIFTY